MKVVSQTHRHRKQRRQRKLGKQNAPQISREVKKLLTTNNTRKFMEQRYGFWQKHTVAVALDQNAPIHKIRDKESHSDSDAALQLTRRRLATLANNEQLDRKDTNYFQRFTHKDTSYLS